ncbi:MAG: NAD-dependent epimerase/dehydratase family protein [Vicinamibacteria bacterium]
MKIAITGVAGFVGSNLTKRLLDRGDQVRGIDDLSHGTLENLGPLLEHPSFRLDQGTILDPIALRTAFGGAEVVVHLAAGKIPRHGDALDTLVINGEGGMNVLRAAHECGARRMVLASTSDCYGRNPQVPFHEESASVIGSPKVRRWSYAVSKMYEEQALFAFRERYGLEGVALRLFGGYGPKQNITWWGGPQSVFIGAVLRGEALDVHGTGQQTRSFTFIDDMVEGFVRGIDEPKADGEVLNIGIDREITIHNLALMISRMIRPDDEPNVRLIPYETFGRYEDVERRIPDGTKSHTILGFRARVNLEEGLPKAIAWQRGEMQRLGLL